MPSWKKVLISGSDAALNSLTVSNGITGSLFGTASFATTAATSSFLSSTTNAFIQNGNSFGATALLGTNDNESLALETSGSTRMFISSSGNVGIGTTSPTFSAGGGLQVVRSDYANVRVTGGSSLGLDLLQSSDGTGYLRNRDNAQLRLGTNNVDVITMTNTGNVGIGTTSPDYKLEVIGDIATLTGNIILNSQDIYANREYSGNDGQLRINRLGYLGGTTTFRDTTIFNGKNSAILSVIGSTGNVGIGTTSPSYKLHVIDSSLIGTTVGSNVVARFSTLSSGKDSTILLSDGVSYSSKISMLSGDLHLSTEGKTSAVTVKATTGNVGIGTTSPYSKFTTLGALSTSTSQISIVNSEGGHTILRTGISGISNAGFSLISADVSGTNQNTRLVVNSAGNVGIGTTNPLDLLHVKSSTDDVRMILDGAAGFDAELKFFENGNGKYTIGYDAASTNFVIGTTNVDTNQRLVITSTGNVGIGTTTPNAKLDVNGDAIITGSLTVTGRITAEEFHTEFVSSSIVFQSGSTKFGDTSDDIHQFTGSLRVNGSITGSLFGTSSWAQNAVTASYTDVGSLGGFIQGGNSFGATAVLGTNDNQSLALETNGSTKMFISSSGDVGIGTTSPSAKLDVNNNTSVSSSGQDTLRVGASIAYATVGSGPKLSFYRQDNNANLASIRGYVFGSLQTGLAFDTGYDALTTKMVIDNSGNVGIGNTSPSYKLDISADNNRARLLGTTGYVLLDLQNNASSFYVGRERSTGGAILAGSAAYSGVVSLQGNYPIYLGTNGAIRATITGAGNVGIGTTTPNAKLDVSGSAIISGSFTVTPGTVREFQVRTTGVDIGNLITDTHTVTGSLSVSGSITGSLFGTASFASTASFLNSTTNAFIQNGNSFGATALLGTNDNQPLAFETSGSERMRILSTGNVGIGTTSPTFNLQVVGTSYASSYMQTPIVYADSFQPFATSQDFVGKLRNSAYKFDFQKADGTSLVVISGSGNVGIGTTDFSDVSFGSPALKVAGSRATLGLVSAGTLSTIAMQSAGGPQIHLNHDSTGALEMYQYSVGAVTFKLADTGNVGIGTTTPNAKLDVNGNAIITGSLAVSQSLLQYSNITAVTSGSTSNVASFSTGSYTAAFFDYVTTSGTNARAGSVFTVWNGANVEYTETSTNDIGSTSNLVLSASVTAGAVRLQATSLSGSWSVKTLARML